MTAMPEEPSPVRDDLREAFAALWTARPPSSPSPAVTTTRTAPRRSLATTCPSPNHSKASSQPAASEQTSITTLVTPLNVASRRPRPV
jgi:hypothetical protein